MKELDDILRLWNRARSQGEEAALATVVKTQGSSYRSPGARLLITSGGAYAGAVSGGCLEDDLKKKAFWLTSERPTVRKYETTLDGEIDSKGYGLGCNGTIYVLLERVTPQTAGVLDLISDVCARRRPAAIAHCIQAELAGQRLILDTSGQITHNLDNPNTIDRLATETRTALGELKSRNVVVEGVEFFVELLTPPLHLLVFGAGDDAVPLVRLAKFLGWRVSVLDGRAHYARRERFPEADHVRVTPAGQSGMGGSIDPWTAAVLMSHSYAQDLANLRELSSYPLRYLGILGPRKRTLQLLADAGLPAEARPALHGPMGLDIGAEGAEQVALAVAAEIQASFHDRPGGLLRERAGAIHSRESGQAGRLAESSAVSV
jgi:xanthine/CO dehydrogenase XdhC/CoxF family maturation factor